MKKLILFICAISVILLLFILIWFSLAFFAQILGTNQNQKQANVTINNPTITFIGDSLTNGYYSDGKLHNDKYGYRQIVTEKTNATSYNFAIGGYTSIDVLNQLESDTTLNEVNSTILEKDDGSLESLYPQTKNNISLSSSIKQSDFVISTIGANDIINELLLFTDDGSFTVDFSNLIPGLNAIYERKLNIYSQIYAINPNIKIIDVGIYMAYPHFSWLFTNGMYPILMYAESKIFIDDKNINTTKVTVRDNMQANIKTYIDNPSDIHPNQLGYDIIANEVLKEMERLV